MAGLSKTGKALLIAAALLGIAFWIGSAAQYLTTDATKIGPDYYSRRYALWLHIAGGTLALFLGPAQIWWGEMRQQMARHRSLGMAYVAGMAITCGTGFYMSLTTKTGLVFATGLFGLSVAGSVTTAMAMAAIKSRQILQHREWMIRSFVTVMGFIAFRAAFGVMMAIAAGSTNDQAIAERLGVAAWFCWSVPLLLTEVALQWRRVRGA